MPNVINGMQGVELVKEINSALDKRGNKGNEGETQVINSDIAFSEGKKIYYTFKTLADPNTGEYKEYYFPLENVEKIMRSKIFSSKYFPGDANRDGIYNFSETFKNTNNFPIIMYTNNDAHDFFICPPLGEINVSYEERWTVGILPMVQPYLYWNGGDTLSPDFYLTLNSDGSIGKGQYKKGEIIYQYDNGSGKTATFTIAKDYNALEDDYLIIEGYSNLGEYFSADCTVQIPSPLTSSHTILIKDMEGSQYEVSNLKLTSNTFVNENIQIEKRNSAETINTKIIINDQAIGTIPIDAVYRLDADYSTWKPYYTTSIGASHADLARLFIISNPYKNIYKSFGGFIY